MSKPRKLRHHRLATTQDRYEVEVWADATDGQLTLYIDCPEHTTWVALTPAEGRAWPYSRFELGFPTAADEEIASYAEDPDEPTGAVYGFVPVSNILLVIAKHGGPSPHIAKATQPSASVGEANSNS